MNYIELKTGDIRKLNDEVRPLCKQSDTGWIHDAKDPEWRGVNLIDHRILVSDLIHLEFRRPTP